MIHIDVQQASQSLQLPAEQQFTTWAEAALRRESAELVIRIVDEEESAHFNAHYRGQTKPTNILSFPFQQPPGMTTDILGDLLACAPVIEREAQQQGKPLEAHWAHIIVHGMLHLQGYDHIAEDEASLMEAEEIAILNGLGIPNPYAEADA